MNKLTLRTINFTHTAALVAACLVNFACSRPKDAKLPDQPDSRVFAINELGNNDGKTNVGTIKLSSVRMEMLHGDENSAINEKPSYYINIQESALPEKVAYMFSSLAIPGQPGGTYSVLMTIDDASLTAYVVSQNINDLSAIDKQISFSTEQLSLIRDVQRGALKGSIMKAARLADKAAGALTTGPKFLPVFKYKIKSKGILERKKNANGEATAELAITPTDFKTASHIQLDYGTEARTTYPFIDPANEDEVLSVFSSALLANQVLPASTLNESYKVNIPSLLERPTAQIFVELKDNKVNFWEMTTGSTTCGSRTETSGVAVNCYLIGSAPASFVTAKLPMSRTGKLADTLKFVESIAPTDLLKIGPATVVSTPVPTPPLPRPQPATSSSPNPAAMDNSSSDTGTNEASEKAGVATATVSPTSKGTVASTAPTTSADSPAQDAEVERALQNPTLGAEKSEAQK